MLSSRVVWRGWWTKVKGLHMHPGVAVIDILVSDRPIPGQITCLMRVVINAQFTSGGELKVPHHYGNYMKHQYHPQRRELRPRDLKCTN